ncbi:uncharacterized protein LOC112567186 [Pomacea canaliculata]|uniref:uncharacterized protein LOC112567186 n=1 Tax=Pomacea canaliculata TaxID=400727 RepID=UPI000D73F24B|nr:uncharacterized protein LOC112567186 [Pomacea canaliculata]
MADKRVWMLVHRLDHAEDPRSNLLCLEIREGETVKEVSKKVTRDLNLPKTGIILQLRNQRGSLIPLNGRLEENSKDVPYTLDILHEYQRVHPKPRSVKTNTYTATILRQIKEISKRISRLEESIPELKVKREEKMKQEVDELERKLSFLKKRLSEADKTQWTGIIKKSPLW